MEKVEWDDIQGLVLSGYPMLPASAYLLWRFLPGEPSAAKHWLRSLAERLTNAGSSEEAKRPNRTGRNLRTLKQANDSDLSAINLALTATGLRHLQIGEHILNTFSLEFQEGMSPEPATPSEIPRRSNLLGDIGASSPEHWDWGGWTKNRHVDGMLLLYAVNDTALEILVKNEVASMAGIAEPILQPMSDTNGLPALGGCVQEGLKEHFGFTDGISQPMIEGSPRSKKIKEDKKSTRRSAMKAGELGVDEERINFVKPGEFILGYLNERHANALNIHAAENHKKTSRRQDLRRNGSYLVFRQLEQDVPAFNAFVAEAAKRIYGDAKKDTTEKFAALLVGRKLDGTPLVRTNASGQSPTNDFLYYYDDQSGMNCPIGAHIRRANPRDTVGPDPDTSLRLSKMHRILRRGRPYGERFSTDKPGSRETSRGMQFIALNADIAGQFEMIQHSWLNNTHFGGLFAGTDPFGHYECPADVITIQKRPANLYIERPRPFVRVRGGAYFFMPGIEAIRTLATNAAMA